MTTTRITIETEHGTVIQTVDHETRETLMETVGNTLADAKAFYQGEDALRIAAGLEPDTERPSPEWVAQFWNTPTIPTL